MVQTARELVLDDLKTSLGAINGRGVYPIKIDTVERGIRSAEEIGEQEFNYLGFSTDPATEETFEHQPGNEVRAVWPLLLVAHLQVPRGRRDKKTIQESREELACDLIDAIFEALNTDTRRGNNAVQTKILGMRTDEGEPDVVASVGPYVTCVIRGQVVYFRTTRITT